MVKYPTCDTEGRVINDLYLYLLVNYTCDFSLSMEEESSRFTDYLRSCGITDLLLDEKNNNVSHIIFDSGQDYLAAILKYVGPAPSHH